MSAFTWKEMDDIDSAITDSITMIQEKGRWNMSEEDVEFSERLDLIQIKLNELMMALRWENATISATTPEVKREVKRAK